MYLCDSHTHTDFSYDGKSTVDELCAAAYAAGLDELVITDHYDANVIVSGFESGYDADGAEKAVARAADAYAGRLRVTYGIELGEPHQTPDRTAALLGAHKFDYIIGSLHNLRSTPDFYYLDWARISPRQAAALYGGYIDETLEMIEFGGFCSLAHFGYPMRYIREAGCELDTAAFHAGTQEVLRALIRNGIALEVNTAGLKKAMRDRLPSAEILALYRELGGRLITIGSDAHRAADAGFEIASTQRLLAEVGFDEFTVYRAAQPQQIRL